MLSRIFLVVFAMFFVASCSSTGGKMARSGSTDATADRYAVASEDVDAFQPIRGSAAGARSSDRVFFGFDSSTLGSSAQKTLNRQAKWLKKNSNVKISIEGHCDERGTREYNLALGDRRANAVKSYLVNSGVTPSRISTVSYGKERPAVAGSNSAAWAENRRSVTVLK